MHAGTFGAIGGLINPLITVTATGMIPWWFRPPIPSNLLIEHPYHIPNLIKHN
jgi:hypothetical protein